MLPLAVALVSAFSPQLQSLRPLAFPQQAAAPCLPTVTRARLQARRSEAVMPTMTAAVGRPYVLTALAACRLPLAVMVALAMLTAAATRLGRRRGPFKGLQTLFKASVPAAGTSPDQRSEVAGGSPSERPVPEAASPQRVSPPQSGGGDGEHLGRQGGRQGGQQGGAEVLSSLLVKCCALSLEREAELGLPRLCVRALPSTVEVEQLEQIFAQARRAVGWA